jgi:hypothetical protein
VWLEMGPASTSLRNTNSVHNHLRCLANTLEAKVLPRCRSLLCHEGARSWGAAAAFELQQPTFDISILLRIVTRAVAYPVSQGLFLRLADQDSCSSWFAGEGLHGHRRTFAKNVDSLFRICVKAYNREGSQSRVYRVARTPDTECQTAVLL